MLSHTYAYTQSHMHKPSADMLHKLPHKGGSHHYNHQMGPWHSSSKATEGLGTEHGLFLQTLASATRGEEVAAALITVDQRWSGAQVLG